MVTFVRQYEAKSSRVTVTLHRARRRRCGQNTFDPAGRMTHMTSPDGTYAYLYDGEGNRTGRRKGVRNHCFGISYAGGFGDETTSRGRTKERSVFQA